MEGEVADKKTFPLWLGNLLAFGLFFAASAAYYLWQIHQSRYVMEQHALAHARMVAGVIQRNAEAAVLTKNATEDILKGLLLNTARFVNYLEQIEPFSAKELEAFAREAGLRGIKIMRSSGQTIDGPQGWLKEEPVCHETPVLEHKGNEHLYLLILPDDGNAPCVAIGADAFRLEALQDEMGLARVAEVLSGMPGMAYVRVVEAEGIDARAAPYAVGLIEDKKSGGGVMEVKLPILSASLLVGIDANYLTVSTRRLWRDFISFSSALALFGGILSFLLYREQRMRLARVMAFERELSKEREDASLGRAAASISHEIRNSLNAVTMGLQRMQVESPLLSSENMRLMDLMSSAVVRANDAVSGLLRYVRSPKPQLAGVSLTGLAENALELYRGRLEETGIKITLDFRLLEPVSGDASLLGQVIENLIKNAIEAQPGGGFVEVVTGKERKEGFFSIRNGGFKLPPQDLERILEPYFTTKADGTGLGLAISHRIIFAHNGRISLRIPGPEQLEIVFFLPLWRGADKSFLSAFKVA
jgi:signal transduction histidine kinase